MSSLEEHVAKHGGDPGGLEVKSESGDGADYRSSAPFV